MALGSSQPLVKMSTRNIPGGKGGQCVKLTPSPPSRAECHGIWEPKPSGTLWATPGLLRESFCPYFPSSVFLLLHVLLPQAFIFSYLFNILTPKAWTASCLRRRSGRADRYCSPAAEWTLVISSCVGWMWRMKHVTNSLRHFTKWVCSRNTDLPPLWEQAHRM